jgi:hypothetical protein
MITWVENPAQWIEVRDDKFNTSRWCLVVAGYVRVRSTDEAEIRDLAKRLRELFPEPQSPHQKKAKKKRSSP